MDTSVSSYRTVDTHGKSQLDLILQVYDGAVTAYNRAREHYRAEEFTPGREQMERAKRFIVHLYTTLNTEEGAEVAENLGKIYAYVIQETDIATATKDTGKIDDIIGILDNLREGWRGLKEQEAEGSIPAEPNPKAAPQPAGGFSTSA